MPAGARRPDHHLQPDLRLPVPSGAEGARHRHRRGPAHRVPRRRRRLPGGPGPGAGPGTADGVRGRHLAGRDHHDQRRRPWPSAPERLRPRLGRRARPHRRLGGRRPRSAPGSPPATDTARLSAAFTVLVLGVAVVHRRAAHYPPSSDHTPPPCTTDRKTFAMTVDGTRPPRQHRRHPTPTSGYRPGPLGRLGRLGHPSTPPHQCVWLLVIVGLGCLRAAGRVPALRRRLAGQRLGVGRRP